MKNSVPLTVLDKVLEVFGAAFLILARGIPLWYYRQIPEIIPVHFDLAGVPNGKGSRIHIILAPLVGVAIYIGLFVVKRYSNYMNYPVPVTPENREKLLMLTLRMMRWIRVAISLFFMVLVISMVRVGLGLSDRANIFLLIYFLLTLACIMGFFMYRMIQTHRDPAE